LIGKKHQVWLTRELFYAASGSRAPSPSGCDQIIN
jgi:hypothetical protein